MPSSCVVHQLQLHHNFITISLGIHCCFQLPYLLVHNTNTLTQPIRARRIGRLLYYATSGTLSLFKSRSGRFGLSLDVSPSLQYGLSHSYSCKIELWPGEFSLHITFQNIEGLQAVLQREYSRFKDFRFSLREPICGVHPSGLRVLHALQIQICQDKLGGQDLEKVAIFFLHIQQMSRLWHMTSLDIMVRLQLADIVCEASHKWYHE